MEELTDKQLSILDATTNRPEGQIVGILANAKNSDLENFLQFDPDKPSKETSSIGFDLQTIQRSKGVELSAQVMEVNDDGKYILRKYDKEGLYSRLSESRVIHTPRHIERLSRHEAAAMVMREAAMRGSGNLMEFFDDEQQNVGGNPFSEFTPLFIGPFYRQQYMYKMLDAKSKAFEAFINNPIGRRIPMLITQFTLGKGVRAEFKDDQAQQLWDEFAKFNKIGTSRGGVNRAGAKLRTWSNMMSVDGESMFHFTDAGEMLKVQSMDTATILEVVCDPEDIEKVFYYHQQYSTPYNIYSGPGIPATRFIIKQIPADSVLHVKLNCYDNEKRGRSDLYPIIGWMKRVKDLINANVIKAYFQACYTWDYTIKGSPQAVTAFSNRNKSTVPTPGSSYYHNENVVREMISPGTHAGSGVEKDMDGLMNMISMGTGIPPVYLLGSMAGSRAAALTETEPSSKFFFERQSIWDEVLHEFADRLFKWARDKRGLQIKNTEVEFSFPQINPMDKMSYLTLMERMKTNKWFTDKRCASLMAQELCATSYDVDSEKNDILEETKEEINREFEENKARSLAETKLQIWQSYFSQQGAQEEQNQLGGQSPTGGSGEGPSASKSGPSSSGGQSSGGAASSKTNSGGMSDKDRASVAGGGR